MEDSAKLDDLGSALSSETSPSVCSRCFVAAAADGAAKISLLAVAVKDDDDDVGLVVKLLACLGLVLTLLS